MELCKKDRLYKVSLPTFVCFLMLGGGGGLMVGIEKMKLRGRHF